jgi:four helix bundle protein
MGFKFEKLDVWQLSLDYIDLIYTIADQLPPSEMYNLKSQVNRAATSVALNIAEGSTSQTDAEQARFLGLAIRSLIETVACLRIIERRSYLVNNTLLPGADNQAQTLARKLHVMRRAIAPGKEWLRETSSPYETDDEDLTLDNQ